MLHARADHPLLTEDTQVLGRNVWQFELHGEAIRHERDQVAAMLGFDRQWGDARAWLFGVKLRW